MKNKERKVARIFEDVGGYYICDDGMDYLDARGTAFNSKAYAMKIAAQSGYTHARGSGTYKGNKLTKLNVQ
jgi:hypothetical protein